MAMGESLGDIVIRVVRENDRLRAEVERLTAENKRLATLAANNAEWRAQRDAAMEKVERLRAENERLRDEAREQTIAHGEWVHRFGNFELHCAEVKRLTAAVKELYAYVDRGDPFYTDAVASGEVTEKMRELFPWLAEHGKEGGDEL